MHETLKKISLTGIVPVIKIDNAAKAAPLANALCQGGIPVAEITFRTEQAEEAIAIISREVPDMLVGAGTILTVEQADRAVRAGAKFIVSPGFNPEVVEYCVNHDILITPGCIGPSDIERAISYGLEVVKFFPAEAAGGLKMIKALSGPYSNIKFIPTGGIDAHNLNEYLSCPQVLACGGSFMVPEHLLQESNFSRITALTGEAVEIMLGFKLAHVGFNCDNEEQAGMVSQEVSGMFHFELSDEPGSVFVGRMFEFMKAPYKGSKGHIAVQTNDIERAVYHLSGKGYQFDEATAKKDSNGKLKSIYFNNEMCGFGWHLVE
jgi:2-dehydro-3-deoxyphosphogluconate aldolase / (4S)-4-hydroxy-2-oxoglutarate aldolase